MVLVQKNNHSSSTRVKVMRTPFSFKASSSFISCGKHDRCAHRLSHRTQVGHHYRSKGHRS
ncbi:hypothetical protein E2C01_063487 [Portunus trituberculatus]|uniref:Uncharacterized protein n=1 Tax=Portunus trituberculatus TaxID=210409 RepID=A0A5B7HAL3_PORTR|nr:hypothetical protein [Portunus trituberculatus]